MQYLYQIYLISCLILTLSFCSQPLFAQVPQETDEVVRIKTELVQTAVTVFDKQGRFVDGLKKEDFELRVAGRLVPISIFENIISGSLRDRLARTPAKTASIPAKSLPLDLSSRQRTIIFFLDDRHLSLDSVVRTRKTLLDFVNKEMGQNELVAIASSSGQIGFLQQFTDNKDVLREAIRRLNHVPYSVADYGKNPGTPMTEYMASTIERKDDPNVFEFFVQDCLKWAPKGVTRNERFSMRRHCEIEVQNRARQILLQAGTVTSGTYVALETLLASSQRMPGSKLAFLISDGFLADTGPRGPISRDRLVAMADRARRAGVVIYTIDARGLTSGALDATGSVPLDPNGGLENANMREIFASQEALDGLAADTGGRAFRNQNSFDRFINEALAETSRYYLIAWRPEENEVKNKEIKKMEVGVVGRPELTVRSARAFATNVAANANETPTRNEKGNEKTDNKPDADLKAALNDFYAKDSLPLRLSLIYLDTPNNGTVLTSSVQAPAELLSYGDRNSEPAQLSIAGVVLDDRGKPSVSFKTALKVSPSEFNRDEGNASAVIYNHRSQLKPGLYQVRVAARDDRSGILGSASQWIVIPDLSKGQLSMSSLIVGLENVSNRSGGESVQWSVDKRFARNSSLRFMTFIYNSGPAASDKLAAQVEVYKEGRDVVFLPFTKIVRDTQGDPNRIPFNGEISLKDLQAGRYVLEVTVKDRDGQAKVSQQTVFYVQ